MTIPDGRERTSNVQCVVYCGSSMTINDWNWKPVVPTVTGASGLAGTFDGGQPITITGTRVHQRDDGQLRQLRSPGPSDHPTTQSESSRPPTSASSSSRRSRPQSPGVTTLANYYITVTTPVARPRGGPRLVHFPARRCFTYTR